MIYVPEDFSSNWTKSMDKVDVGIKKGSLKSRSDFIVKTTIDKVHELEKRGFFMKGNQIMTSYFPTEEQKQVSYDLDLYSRVPRIHEFFEKGIDGETSMKRILEDKQDCLPNGAEDVLKIYKNAKRIVRDVESNPSLKRFLDDMEREITEEELRLVELDRRKKLSKYKSIL